MPRPGPAVAAPTTSLPEQVGGERNWDYRYAWVRDASLSLHALLGLGFTDEAMAFTEWLGDRVQEAAGPGEHPLKIMYRVDGSSDLAEQTLGHWEGYRSSAPVRVGNGAADQLQLDIYGSALECLHFADQRGLPTTCRVWQALIDTVDWVCENWDRPEAGIWETRGGDKDFTYGRLMSWIALDRAIRMSSRSGRPAEVQRWTKERDAIYWQILQRGWSPGRAAFTQYLGSEVLDSALLRMPAVGFIPRMIRDGSRPWTRSRKISCPTASCTGTTPLPLRTGYAVPKAPSRRVLSGTSKPSPAPAICVKGDSSSRRCSPTPIISVCIPRKSG